MGCELPEEQLWSWIDRAAPELEPHLAGCPRCRQLAQEIRAGIRGGAIGLQALAPPLPDRIGSYTVAGFLGEGGQGVVYAAEQHAPRRPVALKVLKAGRFVGKNDLRHFEREIQSMAALQHPGIATIYEAGRTDDGQHFLAMELIRGAPLNHYVRDRALPLRDRLELFCNVCDAVRYAHEHGVIHRDLKPSNILVTAAGQPKILDFGLARPTDGDAALVQSLTQGGQIVGTLRYMSPEQARSDARAVGFGSDVYALGVILYELLTDQAPYEVSREIPDAVRTICEVSPCRPSATVGGDGRPARHLRGDLETIVLKALEKEPARRYAAVADLAADVRRYLDGEAIVARRSSRPYVLRRKLRRYRAGALLAAGMLVLALLAAAGGVWWKHRELAAARRHLLLLQDALERGVYAGRDGNAQEMYQRFPELPEALLVLCQAELRVPGTGGRRANPISRLEAALAQDPSRCECAALLAEIYRGTDGEERAREAQAVAARDPPQTAEAWYLRSFATLSPQRAAACAHAAVTRDSSDVLAWERLARASVITGDLDEALRAAEKLLDIGEDPGEWPLFRGSILARLGRYEEAIQTYDHALSLNPRKRTAYHQRAHVWRRLGDYSRAVADYTKAIELTLAAGGNTVWTQYQRATAEWIGGNADAAAEDYRQARPGPTYYCDARRYIILRDCGHVAEANELLQRALANVGDDVWLKSILRCLAGELAPEDLIAEAAAYDRPDRRCEAYYYAAETYRLAARMDLAQEYFKQCVGTGLVYDPHNFPEPMNEYELAEWRLLQLAARGAAASQP
jgi:tetratricopeptide (TPR) repeat protein/predicted Ser/Thr protein kinase